MDVANFQVFGLMRISFVTSIFWFALASPAIAEVGDPQICTDHPWYPGELAISNFDRLFATQAALYRRVTGGWNGTDQEKALASWLWRNTHYWHGEAGGRDLWGEGLGRGGDRRLREYWTGLFGYLRAEAHLVHDLGSGDPLQVTYAWTDSRGRQVASHVFDSAGSWRLATGKDVRTHRVEFQPQ